MAYNFYIDPDISNAETLPSYFYRDKGLFDFVKEKIFQKSWHFIGDEALVAKKQSVYPFALLDGYLSEPLVLTKTSSGKVSCLSNVCTHRGNLLVTKASTSKKLICSYHGRRFNLKGEFEYMPEFEKTQDFPRACDNLHKLPFKQWGPFLFASLNPTFVFQKVIDTMNSRIGFLPLNEFKPNRSLNKDFMVDAHWALYCDNYLEGFHVPFVHKDLNAILDYGSYKTEIYEFCNLQIGFSNDSKNIFDLPKDHIDHGKNVAAYYYWIFPNLMFNFYPWGLSINLVQPISINKTKVSFMSYVYDADKLNKGAGSGLDKVEQEDEDIVENVQKGIRSSFYKTGRFSPTREQGVHHFHKLIAEFLNR
ncbi:SRPBCC family protein [Flavobacteriaceae bacterium SZ-1-7]|uniref:SRPBCC family protein n=1 Tax=Tamlana sedimenti TaxID=3134126 RepID=UPI003128385A